MTRLLLLNADPGVPVLGHKGASVHVRELAAALSRTGAEVIIAAPRVEPEGDVLAGPAVLAEIPGVLPKRHRTPVEVRAAMTVQVEAVLQLALEHRVEAVLERFSLFSDAGVRVAHDLGIPHVLEVNAPLREEAERFRSLPHAALAAEIEREVFEATDHVAVVSAPLVAKVIAGGADPARVEVLPNGVATDVPVAPARVADGAPFVVGFAGSLKPWHGIEHLLRACDEAALSVPDLRVEVVGHGPLADLLEQTTLGARLVNLGALPHRATLERIASWDVGAAPYLPVEDFYFSPLKVLEYMAAGVCPLASSLGELPSLLGDGARGVLVTPDDPGALAAALCDLAMDRPRVRAIGRLARSYVAQYRSWDINAAHVLTAARAAERT